MLNQRSASAGAAGWKAGTSRTRTLVAKGMMWPARVRSVPEALARMRAHAFLHNGLLIDVARDVVAHRLAFTANME